MPSRQPVSTGSHTVFLTEVVPSRLSVMPFPPESHTDECPQSSSPDDRPLKRRRPQRITATRRDLAVHDPLTRPGRQGPAYLRTGPASSIVPPVYSVSNPDATETPRWRVTAGDGLLAPQYGVRMEPEGSEEIVHPAWAGDDWFAERARLAAVQARRSSAIGSHSTAALLHGIPLPTYARSRKSPVHVVSPRGSAVRLRGVVGHRGRILEPLVTIGGVTICGAVQTLVQLASILTKRDLVVAIEGLAGPWHGSAIPLDAIENAVADYAGARGLVRLRSALARSHPQVGSPKETELRLDLIDFGFPVPLVGPKIWIERMQRHLSPDLLYSQIATVIEYEGVHHQAVRRQYMFDIDRMNAFRSAGLYVERVVSGVPLVDLITTLRDRFRALAAGDFVPPRPA